MSAGAAHPPQVAPSTRPRTGQDYDQSEAAAAAAEPKQLRLIPGQPVWHWDALDAADDHPQATHKLLTATIFLASGYCRKWDAL